MGSTTVQCRDCGTKYQVPSESARKQRKCKNCGGPVGTSAQLTENADDDFWLTDYGSDSAEQIDSQSEVGRPRRRQEPKTRPNSGSPAHKPRRKKDSNRTKGTKKSKVPAAVNVFLSEQVRVPLILIAVSLVIFVGFGFYLGGATGALITIVLFLVAALIQVVLGVAACYLVAALLDTSFGELKEACVKLAAITVFPSAVALVLGPVSPFLAYLVVVGLFFGLLMSLFELEFGESLIFVVVLWAVQFLAKGLLRML